MPGYKIYNLQNKANNLSGRALALGMMDGVHLGHKKLIKSAVNFAKENKLIACAMTFEQAPISITNPGKKIESLTSLEERLLLFSQLGLHQAIVFDFAAIFNVLPEDYLNINLRDELRTKYLTCGANHRFGKDQMGCVELLKQWANQNNIVFAETPFAAVKDIEGIPSGTIVSSSLIRNKLKLGRLREASSLLGHSFFIYQQVVPGQKLGQKLGFPTLNFNYDSCRVRLPLGVYAARLYWQNKSYKAAANLGYAPTVNRQLQEPVLEVHILKCNASAELPKVGDLVKVDLLKHIRPEKKFDSLEELKAQIRKDSMAVLKLDNADY